MKTTVIKIIQNGQYNEAEKSIPEHANQHWLATCDTSFYWMMIDSHGSAILSPFDLSF